MEKTDALKMLGVIQAKQFVIDNSIRKQQIIKSEVKSLGQKISGLQKERDVFITSMKLKTKLTFNGKTK